MVDVEGAPYIPSLSKPLVRILIATPLCGPHHLTCCTLSLSRGRFTGEDRDIHTCAVTFLAGH